MTRHFVGERIGTKTLISYHIERGGTWTWRCDCGQVAGPMREVGLRLPCSVCDPRNVPSARFWRKVDKSGECWIWTAARVAFGYGKFKFGDGAIDAHRVSWELHYGPIPAGMWVLHRCDRPECVRPEHLFLGTAKDNSRDMMRKGRGAGQFVPGHTIGRRTG